MPKARLSLASPFGSSFRVRLESVVTRSLSTRSCLSLSQVLVARGVVARVEQASFEIIPLSSASSPLFIFTDATVDALYGDRFVAGFERLGYVTHKVVIPDGEDAKTLEVFAALADKVLSIGIDKHSVLISLGGGAVSRSQDHLASPSLRRSLEKQTGRISQLSRESRPS